MRIWIRNTGFDLISSKFTNNELFLYISTLRTEILLKFYENHTNGIRILIRNDLAGKIQIQSEIKSFGSAILLNFKSWSAHWRLLESHSSILFVLQVKLELSGSSGGGGGAGQPPGRHHPVLSAALSSSPGSGQGGGSKDAANPDDPLAAIMNQTIFGGESITEIFIRRVSWSSNANLHPVSLFNVGIQTDA